MDIHAPAGIRLQLKHQFGNLGRSLANRIPFHAGKSRLQILITWCDTDEV